MWDVVYLNPNRSMVELGSRDTTWSWSRPGSGDAADNA
jgi:hypothetical protein